MVDKILCFSLAMMAGLLLGTVFFGGLWWTVQKGISSGKTAVWLSGSLLLRMGIVLTGFYFTADGHWDRLLACLSGFLIMRTVVTRLVRSPEKKSCPGQEVGNASHS